jgi:hypothetical protein
MAKLGGLTGLGAGFGGLTPAKAGLKGGVVNQGGSLGKNVGTSMSEKQGKGGVQAKGLGQVQTSVGSPGAKMDDRNGKGVVNKSVGQIQTSTGGTGEKMGSQGS